MDMLKLALKLCGILNPNSFNQGNPTNPTQFLEGLLNFMPFMCLYVIRSSNFSLLMIDTLVTLFPFLSLFD